MKDQQETIPQIKRTLRMLLNTENEKLYHLVNETQQELELLNCENVSNEVAADLVKAKYNNLYSRILSVIKKENTFILPYIDKILDKSEGNASDTFSVYKNLTVPLKMHLLEQSKIMEELEMLKEVCFSSTADSIYGKVILNVIETCELFERNVFVLQRMLIPSVVHLMEMNSNHVNKTKASYVAA